MAQLDIILTQNAARRVAAIAARQSKPAILRLSVDGGGCAGFTYKFELAEAPEGDDTVARADGATLVVDPVSLDLVRGSAVDYVEDLGGAAFRVTNPNAASGVRLRLQLQRVKLSTYNVNGIRARLPRLLQWLERDKPDIVCLQELKCADDALPVADVEAAGYPGVWHGQKGFNGVAILARGEAPALRQVGLPGDPDDTHSRYIEAEVGGLIVGSLYLPNGNPVGTEKFSFKLSWFERLIGRAAQLLQEERPVVLAGDWNVVPEDRDVFSVQATAHDAVTQPEAREAWRRLVHQGWTDALRALHPDEPKLYTFWDYTAGCWQRDLGFRLDHLLCSPEAADRLQGAGVDKWARGVEKASDHAPTWVALA